MVCIKVFYKRIDVEKVKQSVMLIYAYDENNEMISSGSGFIAFEDDILITNAHVVEDASKIEVISENNDKYNVLGMIGYNKKKDIAIFKLEKYKKIKKLPITKKINVGDTVYAVGSPLGIKNTVSNGILSGVRDDEKNTSVFQYTAPISPGSSGGALLNQKGEVVGITFATIEDGQNLNLAIKISDVEKLYKKQKEQFPVLLSYKELLSSKVKSTKSIKNIITKFHKLVKQIDNTSKKYLEDDEKLKLIFDIKGTNGEEFAYYNDILGETNVIASIESFEPERIITFSKRNPVYHFCEIQIYEKNINNISEFKDEINNSLGKFEEDKTGFYEDDDYFYYVQYYGYKEKQIDKLFNNN